MICNKKEKNMKIDYNNLNRNINKLVYLNILE